MYISDIEILTLYILRIWQGRQRKLSADLALLSSFSPQFSRFCLVRLVEIEPIAVATRRKASVTNTDIKNKGLFRGNMSIRKK